MGGVTQGCVVSGKCHTRVCSEWEVSYRGVW